MAPPRAELREAYQRLYDAGVAKVRTGDFRGALDDFGGALGLAREAGDPGLQYEAQANLSMVYIQLGEERRAEKGLREILLNSREHKVRFGAAYNLAVSQRKQGRYARAHFYAAMAMDSAVRVRDASARAGCHNLLGNILMSQSFLDKALVEYRKALRIRRRQKSDVRFSIAILLENIGYTYLLKKRFRLGASMIARALELATAVQARRCIAECCQDLSYAKMQMHEYDKATEMGEKALAIALESGYRDVEKNCYYLLGESAHLAGRIDERDRHFERLQSLHPELPFLRDFLCAFDLSEILTLKH
jgi:tetratricopeptide (TPR) repeat protein